MKKTEALKQVKAVFSQYTKLYPADRQWLTNLQSGKVYELYCLAEVIKALRHTYGYRLRFVGSSIKFKSSPGMVKVSDPHFEVVSSNGRVLFHLYTDIEFLTLGSHLCSVNDLSSKHEIDIVAVPPPVADSYPTYQEIVLAVECKSHRVFPKSVVKETLGIRRELSLLCGPQQSALSATSPNGFSVIVTADPASEYWVAFASANGSLYAGSPRAFGIEYRHWMP